MLRRGNIRRARYRRPQDGGRGKTPENTGQNDSLPPATDRGAAFASSPVMGIFPTHNLTVTLIRRAQFSDLRLRGSVPRRVVPMTREVHLDRFPWQGSFPHDCRKPDKAKCEEPVSYAPSLADHLGRHVDVLI